MIPFKSENTINKITESDSSHERSLLQIYTDRRMSEKDGDEMLKRVADHRWFVSERLNRDVGFHVAAIDYVENFYDPSEFAQPDGALKTYLAYAARTAASALKAYFVANSKSMPV